MKGLIILCLIWIGDAIRGIAVNEDMYSFKEGGRTTNVISLVVAALVLPVLIKIARANRDKRYGEFLYEHDADFREEVELGAWYSRAQDLRREEPDAFNKILSRMRAREKHATLRNELREARPDWSEEDVDTAFVASFLREYDRGRVDADGQT